MSAEGLGPQLDAVRAAWVVALDVPRRFAKPTQRGGCVAMDVVLQRATLTGRRVDSAHPDGSGCEGLLLEVEPQGGPGLAKREGYPPDCWSRLVEAAGGDLGSLLLRLAEDAGDDILAYRQALHALAAPFPFKACHYLPHPLVLDGGPPAVIFVSPEPGTTGVPGVDSAKAAHPRLGFHHLRGVFDLDDDRYPGFDPARQARYIELCLLAGAHGIWVGDLLREALSEVHPASALLRRWREDPSPLREERRRLGALLKSGLGPEEALERSGLTTSPTGP